MPAACVCLCSYILISKVCVSVPATVSMLGENAVAPGRGLELQQLSSSSCYFFPSQGVFKFGIEINVAGEISTLKGSRPILCHVSCQVLLPRSCLHVCLRSMLLFSRSHTTNLALSKKRTREKLARKRQRKRGRPYGPNICSVVSAAHQEDTGERQQWPQFRCEFWS